MEIVIDRGWAGGGVGVANSGDHGITKGSNKAMRQSKESESHTGIKAKPVSRTMNIEEKKAVGLA
jgi:hypothetical protein